MDPKRDSKRQELGIMGPPPAMPHSNNSRADAPLSPASTPSNPKAAAPPRRIIKKINLDFKKLKEAGLDRKLAEVLSKQNQGAKAGITHSPSSSSSSLVATQSTSATATTTAAAAEAETSAAAASGALHSQQFHQPALPQSEVKRIKISDGMEKTVPIPPTSSSPEHSINVKAVLKNRILNKSMNTSTQIQKQKPMPPPKTPPTAAQGSASRSGGSSNASSAAATSGAFPIPKADLSVRPKNAPLLLNLVNQLPKHRSMCVTTDNIQLRNQQELLQQKAFEKHPPPQQKQAAYQPQISHISVQKSSEKPQHIPIENPPQAPTSTTAENPLISPPPEASIISQKSPSPPPLIVLENKVLAPYEKMDLSNLGLPGSTSIVATILKTKSQPGAEAIIKGGKVIMNASKFKVPREKLAEMALEIRNRAQQVILNTNPEAAVPPEMDSSNATIKISTSTATEVDPVQQSGFTPSTNEAKDLTSLQANVLPNLTPPEIKESGKPIPVAAPSDQGEHLQDKTIASSFTNIPVSSAEPEEPKVVMSTETSFLDLPIHISTDSEPKQTNMSPDPEQESLQAVERPNAPESTTTAEADETSSPAPKVQSAVDFIAQLTADNSLDESSFMDLSPEEQQLNALFGGAGGCSFTGMSFEKTEKEKNVEAGGSSTVTTPSSNKLTSIEEKRPEEEELPIGKIMKMDDMDILHATLDVSSDSTNILRISPNAIKLRSSVDKPIIELPPVTTAEEAILATNAESLDASTSPIESHKVEQASQPDMPSKGSLEIQIEPVIDAEPAKEVNPPAKRVPLRSKKAKINLVQRNKRPSIQNKALDAKKAKLDEVEASDAEFTSGIIDHSFLEENRTGAQGIEVPADEEQGVIEFREDDDQQDVSQSKEVTEQGVNRFKDDEMQQEVRYSNEDKQQGPIESTEYESKKASSPVKGTKANSQADNQNAAKSSIERDLTQLYHPPKMPKTKKSNKNSNQKALEDSQPPAAASVSLIEILTQEPQPPQGDAKLPFRKELPAEVSTPESTGIQNLMTHLTAEKVTPQSKKKLSPSPSGSEETTKGMPRKKRTKTRPVLTKRNSGKKQEENALEFLHPVCENAGGSRIPTSSTSDDDGSVFLGFNKKNEKRSKTPVRSKRVRQMRINETDISDDATPDYDETEEEQQRPVNNDFRRIDHVSDSDSSECPIYLDDNPVTEDTSLDKTPVSKEAASLELVKWEDLISSGKESTIEPEKQQHEALIETDQSASVINEKDSTIEDKKSRSNRKSKRKPSPKKELDTTAVEIGSEKPSTSKEALKTSKAKAKLQSKSGSGEEDFGKRILPQTSIQNEEISVSNENQKELKAVEESVTSVKSKGKGRCRSSKATSNKAAASLKTETSSDEHKINKELKEAVETTEKRKTRTSSVSKPVIDKAKEEQELTNSVNLKGKRASRHQAKSDSPAPEITELAATSNPSEPIDAVKTRASRMARSRTPKEPLPAQPITKLEEIKQTQQEPEPETEEVKSKIAGISKKRQSRSRKSTVAPPPVAKDELKLDEEIKNTDSQIPEEVSAVEEPNHSPNLKSKRQLRCKTDKAEESAVSKSKTYELGCQGKNKDAAKPNLASTCGENSKYIDATEDEDKPSSSIKSKRKRQSRNTPRVSKLVAVDEIEPGSSQPAETDADAAVARGTRRSSSRLSSAPQDTADEVKTDCVPKKVRKTSLTTEPQNLAADKVNPDDAPPLTSKRKRKGETETDSESTKASKREKTDGEQDPGVPEDFNIRLLLIRERKQLDSDEVLTQQEQGRGPLQCGLCLARSTEKDWQTHLAEHYGVGWPVGETPNVTRSWVLKNMKKYYDGGGKKLTCRLCQRQLGSHIGMLQHLEGCGNKQRVECDLCKKSYVKSSLPVHRQSCSGQQKKDQTACSFNLRLLLIRKREQLDSEEVLTDEGKGDGPLQCGVCLARCSKGKWQSHLEEHYGVGWLVGEAPKNISRSSVMLMMKAYLDESKKKLVCRLCGHHLGSALGMMLHLETCGNKQRVECDICKRSYTILTLQTHYRSCKRRQQLAETSMAEQQKEEDANEMVLSNAGRAKRRSTIKAETKLKNIGEHSSGKNEFDGNDSSDYDMANDKESSEEYESEGVDSNEDSITAEQDGSDCEKSKHSRKRTGKRRPVSSGEHAAKPLFLREETQKSNTTYKWKEFKKINYSEISLYCHLVPDYSTLPLEDAQSLLPSKEATSVRYAYGKATQDSDWQRLAPLEGFSKEGEYVGYLGGPVRQLAWVPLPSTTTDQYLLCSLRSRIKSFARHSKLKQEDGLLMLLKCTEEPSNDETGALRPELHYGIRVPNGPVHSFAFLPSGGYDQATNRLGLLAVAHATSDVHIYALPLKLKDEEKCGENVVIQLEPVITLSLDVDQPHAEDQGTKICWSEASGHTFLATGYASGRLAFWDIGDTESINCFRGDDDQTYTFVPLNSLYLGERNIQFMELHYDMNGTRWLAVGTSVRKFMVYDIMNWSQPTTLMQSAWNNIYLTTFTWSPVCEAIILSSNNYNSRAILLNPAGTEFESRTLDGTLKASRSMHANYNQNYMVLVTDNGDLVFLDAKAVTRGVYVAKTMINYRAVSTTELRHLGSGKPNSTDVISTDEFHRDYGVQINPLAEAHPQSARTCPYLSKKRLPRNPHSLSLMRNNCVRCNWNSPDQSWVAMGAEHGLLRIINFKRNNFF